MDQLLIALDVPTGAEALASGCRHSAASTGGFKIGSRLFTAEGPEIVRRVVALGERVFLDLKFHDIPNTVATAVEAATALGVWMVNVHASGGSRMMRAARDAAHDTAARLGTSPPLVIAVTVLTSMNERLARPRPVCAAPVLDQVLRLADARSARRARRRGRLAPGDSDRSGSACGAGLRDRDAGHRGGGARTPGKDDQERTMTPAEAIAAGANYLVVGRPIIAAPDPRRAAEEIAEEMRGGSVLRF